MVRVHSRTEARGTRTGAAGARVGSTVSSLLLISLLLVSCAPAAVTPRLVGSGSRSAARPNIVVVLTDDQRFDELGLMPVVQSQLLDRGINLNAAYVVNSLCCPSRASLLTGQYSHTTGLYLNGDTPAGGGYPDFNDASTVAKWLHDVGYRTGLFGKYLNHYHDTDYVPPGWDRWVALMAPNSVYYQYDLTANGTVRYFGSRPSDYSTDVYARYADAFIRHAPADQPIFAWVAPAAPHGPTTPPVRYETTFPDLVAAHRPNFNEADVSDKPAYIRRLPPLTAGQDASMDVRRRQTARTLLAVDDLVASLLSALRDTGRLDNTLFVLMSDNGVADGEHRWRYKMDPYEESIRVPMVMRWDGVIAPGTSSTDLVTNIDLAPTFAQVAGAAAPNADGVSMMPVLKGTGSVRRNFLIEHQHFGARYDPPTYCAVRSGTWLFVHYASGEEELYDLKTDPYELSNRASDAAYAGRVRELRKRDRTLCDPLPQGMDPF